MFNDWPTKDSDLALAEKILLKHVDMNEGEPISVIDCYIDKYKERMDMQLSDWIVELTEIFTQKYGDRQGEKVTRYIVTHCLTEGQTIH